MLPPDARQSKQSWATLIDYAISIRILSVSARAAGLDCAFNNTTSGRLFWDLDENERQRLRTGVVLMVFICLDILACLSFPVSLYGAFRAGMWIPINIFFFALMQRFDPKAVTAVMLASYCLGDGLLNIEPGPLRFHDRMIALLPLSIFTLRRLGIIVYLVLYFMVMYITQNHFSLVGNYAVPSAQIAHPPGVDQMGWIFLSILLFLCDGSSQFLARQWEDAVIYKADFRAQMSHELRTPLFSIIGAVDLLKKTRLDSWQYQLVNLVDRFAKNLVGWVSALLDTSKIFGGRPLEIEKRITNLPELIDNVIEVVRPMAIAKGIVLVHAIDKCPKSIITDPMRLHQIVANHLIYSLKLASPGNLIELDVFEKTPDDNLKSELQAFSRSGPVNRVVVFKVQSHGVERDASSKYCQALHIDSKVPSQASLRALKLEVELSLSNYILTKIGGTIRYATSDNNTWSFSIIVPTGINKGGIESEPKNNSDLAINQPLPPLRNPNEPPIKVLIAEDNPINQLLLIKMAEYLHFEVDMVPNGLQVLRKVRENSKCDVILLDLEMPSMGGAQCTQALRRGGFRKPIMIMSSHALEYQQQALMGMDVQCLLLKPITIQSLYAAVDSVLNRNTKQQL